LNIMGKSKRLKRKRRGANRWVFSEFSDRLTANFQKEIRNSELWDQMVAEFGKKRAEEILGECKAELKPGPMPDETGDRTKDIS
jgi:uncharacterized protein YaaW (UPF0174 family)